ncbi:alcohol dehydrogenase [Mycobacterium sp. MS1601]|uniref:quinone oxidoreductase family protein n=1 Tax=Mycobacterium sp. MS1601 TaxID=1936029 RepID=UPI000979272C|nr:zinc-binding alcohol dehydrogenase family protein [Mycobacterium sp. MS1601]AQA04261.1 alcohol dehydrogenase [Mycobacterium sp. MS1601]
MKAAIVEQFGTAPRYADVETPLARDGLVVADVAAASVKNLDRGLVSGQHYGSSALKPPFVPGTDGVARLSDGALVYAQANGSTGFMAEQTVVDPTRAVPVPAGLDPVRAAAIPNPGLSAWLSLEVTAQVQPGARILVLGATGVTGAVAVQLAKRTFGAKSVVAVGRNAERLQWLRTRGADDVLVLGTGALTSAVTEMHAADPFDIVLDYLWGTPAEQTLTALGGRGLRTSFHSTRYVQVGSMAGPDITLPAGILRSAGIELVGFGIGSVPAEALGRARTQVLPALFDMVSDGTLDIAVQERALADVTQVWDAPEPAGHRTVLVP